MKLRTIVCNGYFGCRPTYPSMQIHVLLVDSQQFTVLIITTSEIAEHLIVFSNFFLIPFERNTFQALYRLYFFSIFGKIFHISYRIDIIMPVRNCQFECGMRCYGFRRRFFVVLNAHCFRFFISFSIFINNYIHSFTHCFTLRKRIFLQASLFIIQQYTEAIDSLDDISRCTRASVQCRGKGLKLHSCPDYTLSFAHLTASIEQIILTRGNIEKQNA